MLVQLLAPALAPRPALPKVCPHNEEKNVALSLLFLDVWFVLSVKELP